MIPCRSAIIRQAGIFFLAEQNFLSENGFCK